MKILWHSNAPWAQTGYGQQTAIFTPRIRALGHDVAISAFWGLGGARMEWEGMKVLPSDDHWGNRLLPAYASYHAEGDPADCQVITLMDVWVLNNDAYRQMWMACWVPVDHDPLPPRVRDTFERFGLDPIAMSKFGQRQFENADLPAMYVPHGVDTSVFKPGSRDQVRDAIGVPRDAFLVGMVANNKGTAPPRKAFPQVFEAFKRLRDKHTDALLYLHCEKFGVAQGLNLVELAEMIGIDQHLRWVPQLDNHLGIPQAAMGQLYSTMDVLVNPSYGEGFGIPIVEAQACGTPVIVSDWTSMTELCGAGWLVEGERWYDASHGSWYLCPSVGSVTDGLMEAYDKASGLTDQAVEFASQYDANHVLNEYWKPTLDMLRR